MKLAALLYAIAVGCFVASAWLERGAVLGLFIAGIGFIVPALALMAAWTEGVRE